MKLCLVASSGGHLIELVGLKEVWEKYERFWISFLKEDAQTLLEGERVIWAYHPTNRNVKNLIKNLGLAWRVLRRERPDVIFSTGAGVAVPFLWIGRILGIRTVYLELLTRIRDLSLTGKLVYPFADRIFVQWPELTERYPKALYRGSVVELLWAGTLRREGK